MTRADTDICASVCGRRRSAADRLTEKLQIRPFVDGGPPRFPATDRQAACARVIQPSPFACKPTRHARTRRLVHRIKRRIPTAKDGYPRVEATVISDGICANYHSVDIAIGAAFLAAPCNGPVVPGSAHPPRVAAELSDLGVVCLVTS